MRNRWVQGLLAAAAVAVVSGTYIWAQKDDTHIHVVVNMVQLNVAVTDNSGNYVTGLRPQDFAVVEDGIAQKLATFAEGNEPTRRLLNVADNGIPQEGPVTPASSKESLAFGALDR
jgi:hypothetical protein